ncbi:MAG: hypothetical protein DDT38_00126 [Firmicutes bacterium]|nr:hypothetical protein [candidate division NPL-UPA2 bacterium]
MMTSKSFFLSYARFAFQLEARAEAILPPYLGSTLRGVLGRAFRDLACMARRPDCGGCMFISRCAYAYVFETNRLTVPEETGHYYVPHPFVLEPPLEQRTYFAKEERLAFNLVLLGQGLEYLPFFIAAFHLSDKLALGAKRYPFALVKVDQLLEADVIPVWNEGSSLLRQPAVQNLIASLNGQACGPAPEELTVLLETPARLVYEGQLAHRLDFPLLMRALFRRLGLLGKAHGRTALALPFQELLHAAGTVEAVQTDLVWQDWDRYSSRQRTKLQMGGLVGSVRFRGKLQPFLPFLRMGEIVHVGKGTVFGLGKIKLQTMKSSG